MDPTVVSGVIATVVGALTAWFGARWQHARELQAAHSRQFSELWTLMKTELDAKIAEIRELSAREEELEAARRKVVREYDEGLDKMRAEYRSKLIECRNEIDRLGEENRRLTTRVAHLENRGQDVDGAR